MSESEYKKVDDIKEVLSELVENQKRMNKILLLLTEAVNLNNAIDLKYTTDLDASKRFIDFTVRLDSLLKS